MSIPVDNNPCVFTVSVGQTIAEVEGELILRTLKYFDGDKKRCAVELGVSLKTLYNKLHQYGEMPRRNSS